MAVPNVIGLVLKVTGIRQVQAASRQFNRMMGDMSKASKKAAATVSSTTKSYTDLTKASADLANSGASLQEQLIAMGVAAEGASLGGATFIKTTQEAADATKDLGGKAKDAEEKINFFGIKVSETALNLGIMSAAVGIVIAIIRRSISAINDAVDSFVDYNNQIRRLRLQLGLTAQEASVWLRALELSGITAKKAERALTTFGKKIADARLDIAAGGEVTDRLARAFRILGLTADDVLLPVGELLDLVNRRLAEMEPGLIRNEALMTLFGFAGRDMAVILGDDAEALADMRKALDDNFISLVDTTGETRKLVKAKADLKLAVLEAKSVVAREWIPVLIRVNEVLAKLLRGITKVDVASRAYSATLKKFGGFAILSAEALGFFINRVSELAGVTSEAAKEEEKLAEARREQQEATIIAAEAERALADERQKNIDKLQDLQRKLGDKLIDIQTAFNRKWTDLEERRLQDSIERGLRLAARMEEIAARINVRRIELGISLQQKLEDVELRRGRDIEDFRDKIRREREDLEIRHQERLFEIQTRFLDTLEEAVRRNDAVAVVRAIRQRNRDLRDAEHEKRQDKRKLETGLSDERAEIEKDARRRREDAERRFRRQQEKLARQFAQQMAALRRRNELERTIRKTHDAFIERQLRLSQQRQEDDVRTHYIRERNIIAQQLGLEKAEIDRAIRATGTVVAKATADSIALIARTAQRSLGIIGGRTVTVSVSGGPGSPIPRAEGGIDVVTRPTTFLAGEAGPEVAAFMPLGGNMNVNHNFSRLSMDLNGAGGMNLGQVQNVVFRAMTELARTLTSGRR